MKYAVEVENLSKKYAIGEKERYLVLSEILMKLAKAPVNLLKGKGFRKKKEFWALKDVNFKIGEGEVVGIIGRNGAGKSTLLKVLSRITEPTEGTIRMHGRVSSLLEVGTGFHPELTGRENIYLNGAILGMSRKEIDSKFDEIVEFSGVEKFLDMPVKRYSSGMQVRLAFSVAAHLEPDVLIIDEVLAVGDAEFQKKCLGKMDEVTKNQGRTILFVSHDMGAIRRICSKCILMEDGKVAMYGNTDEVVERYMSSSLNNDESSLKLSVDKRPGNKSRVFKSISLSDTKDKKRTIFNSGESLAITGEIENNKGAEPGVLSVSLYREDGLRVSKIYSEIIPLDENEFKLTINNIKLLSGKYYFNLWFGGQDGRTVYDHIENYCRFEVINLQQKVSNNRYSEGVVELDYIWKSII